MKICFQGLKLNYPARVCFELLCSLASAHAKLMCQVEVTVQDAVVAVTVMESSMQGATLLGAGVNVLHSAFPKDPNREYSTQGMLLL